MSLLDNLISGAANAAAQVAPVAPSTPQPVAKPHPCPVCRGVLFYSHDPSGKPKKCAICHPITQPGFRLWTLMLDENSEPIVVEHWEARYLHAEEATPTTDPSEWWKSSPHNLYDKLRVRLPEPKRPARQQAPPSLPPKTTSVDKPKSKKSLAKTAKTTADSAVPPLFGDDVFASEHDNP